MDLRRLIGAVGRFLIGAGVLLLLFVAYQLWGTNLREARAQRDLRRDFERSLVAPAPDGDVGRTTTTTVPAPPVPGDAVAVLRIPRIGVDKAVIEGVGVPELKKGPGHYPGTPLPGQPGNAAIAGHRTTYGAPFWSLDKLETGDEILVTTRQGDYRYEVMDRNVVRPSQVEVLDPTEEARLTLTTCDPRFSARRRLIVTARLVGRPAPAPPPPSVSSPRPASLDIAGLSGDRAGRGPALLWGLIAALVGLVTWAGGRWWRRWPSYVLGGAALLGVLFVFFEQVARLLPANV